MNSTFVILTGALAGILLGALSGFGLSAEKEYREGRPLPKKPILAFLARPTAQMNFLQTLALFGIVVATLPLSFSLLLAPLFTAGLVGSHNESALVVAMVVECIAIYFSRWLGAWLWWQVS